MGRALPLLVVALVVAQALPLASAAPARVDLSAPAQAIVGQPVRFTGLVREDVGGFTPYASYRAVEIRSGATVLARTETDLLGRFDVVGALRAGGPQDVVAVAAGAVSGVGASAPVRIVGITPPGAPGLAVEQQHWRWRQATVDVTLPASDGFAPVREMEVEQRSGTGELVRVFRLTGNASEVAMVEPSATHAFRARARNVAGWGPFAEVVLATPPPPPADRFQLMLGVVSACGQPCMPVGRDGWAHPYTPVDHAQLAILGTLFARGDPILGAPVAYRLTAASSLDCVQEAEGAPWTCPPGGRAPDPVEGTSTQGFAPDVRFDPVPGGGTRREWSYHVDAWAEGFHAAADAAIRIVAYDYDGGGEPPCLDGCSGGSD